MNSFRIKIAALSGAISAAALLGVGWFLWEQTGQWNLDRVDNDLAAIGRANLQRPHGRNHFRNLDVNLNSIVETNAPPAYRLRVWEARDRERVLYHSESWPESWGEQTFAKLPRLEPKEERADPPPPKSGGRRGGRPPEERLRLKTPRFETRTHRGEPWRVATMGNRHDTMALAKRITDLDSDLKRLREMFVLALGMALAGVALAAWWLAGRALRPVTALTRTVERVTAEGLDHRISAKTQDREFSRLITVFNEMMDRLEKSFSQAIRFSADASHELKTPLTVMQGELERAMAEAEPDSERQRLCARMLEEIQRLKSILQKLLLLSRADAGELKLNTVEVDLSEMVRELSEDAGILAPHLEIEARVESGVHAKLDADLFSQVLRNLLSNAVNYNCDGGWIRIELQRSESAIRICVANSGEGIPEEERAHVFERFRRGAKARASGEGAGLGLSLSREIVRAHGGELRLADSTSGETTFIIFL